ncbi:hypothetical protein SLA2020_039070 [Shorea laevis]
MKGASKVIMGATLVMVVSLAIVLGLILVLLAELYCSLLLRRRKMRESNSDTTLPTTAAVVAAATNVSAPSQEIHYQSTSPLSSFYAQGVLRAPRSLLFPIVYKETKVELDPTVLEVHAAQESNQCLKKMGILSPPLSISSISSPNLQEISIKIGTGSSTPCDDKACGGTGGSGKRDFVYISNPIYDNEACRANTPFETPDTSPSRLEDGGSSDDDDEKEIAQPSSVSPHSPPLTPPLTPMKKLPAQACSVSLRDARSLGTSSNDSNSNNGLSLSSSDSPCTSPSW